MFLDWDAERLVYCEGDFMLCAHLGSSADDDGLEFLRKSKVPFDDYTLGVNADLGREDADLREEPYGAMSRVQRLREAVQRGVAGNFCPDVPDAAFGVLQAAVVTWRGDPVHQFKSVDGLRLNPFKQTGRHTYKGAGAGTSVLSINNLDAPQKDHALVSGADCQFWTEKREQGSSICVGDGRNSGSKKYQSIIGRLDNGAERGVRPACRR